MEGETLGLATVEVSYTGRYINQYLKTVVARTVDAIKGKRKSPEYQRLLVSIRDSRRRSGLLLERISQTTTSETPD